jgi:hypothetical protein
MAAKKPRSREKPTKGLLEVTVHDADGQPRRRLRVQLSSGRTDLGEILTDDDGVVEFPDLSLGEKYLVRVNGDETSEEILLMERAKESLEIEYEAEAVRGPDDEDESEDAEDEEDLDSPEEPLEDLG